MKVYFQTHTISRTNPRKGRKKRDQTCVIDGSTRTKFPFLDGKYTHIYLMILVESVRRI